MQSRSFSFTYAFFFSSRKKSVHEDFFPSFSILQADKSKVHLGYTHIAAVICPTQKSVPPHRLAPLRLTPLGVVPLPVVCPPQEPRAALDATCAPVAQRQTRLLEYHQIVLYSTLLSAKRGTQMQSQESVVNLIKILTV